MMVYKRNLLFQEARIVMGMEPSEIGGDKNTPNDHLMFGDWICRAFKWMFPKILVPPNHPILIGFSIINHTFWVIPIFGNIQIQPFIP